MSAVVIPLHPAPGPTAAPEPERSGLPPALPCWRLYLYGLASLGLYWAFWIYRTAAALDPGERRRVKHLGWALGAAFPVFGCLVLFELGRLARQRRSRRRRGRDPGGLLPAIWLGLVACVLWVTPLRWVFTAHLLFLTLPFLTVQATVNAAHLAGGEPVPAGPWWTRWWVALPATIAGLAASAWVYRTVDREAYSFAATVTTPGREALRSKSGRFELVPPRGWIGVAPGTVGSEDSDLELSRFDRTAWLVAYVRPAAGEGLGATVAARRALIGAEGTLRDFTEGRAFLHWGEYDPLSVATYWMVPRSGQGVYRVATALVDGQIFELVGWSQLPAKDLPVLHQAMATFRPLPVKEGKR